MGLCTLLDSPNRPAHDTKIHMASEFDYMRHDVYTHLQDVEITFIYIITCDPFQRLLERGKISTPARIVLDNCYNRTKRHDAPYPARARDTDP